MLNTAEVAELFGRIGTPPAGQRLIDNARNGAPVCVVASQHGSVIIIPASQKMARDTRIESRHFELAVVVSKKDANDVLKYRPRPCQLKLIKLVMPLTPVSATALPRSQSYTRDSILMQ